jgi:hypothetical protein
MLKSSATAAAGKADAGANAEALAASTEASRLVFSQQ